MIIELLPKGKENAISTQTLCKAAGFDNVRTLRSAVAKERKEGALIASSSKGGYYIPADDKELEEFVSILDRKARSIMVVLQPARKALRNAQDPAQMILEGR